MVGLHHDCHVYYAGRGGDKKVVAQAMRHRPDSSGGK